MNFLDECKKGNVENVKIMLNQGQHPDNNIFNYVEYTGEYQEFKNEDDYIFEETPLWEIIHLRCPNFKEISRILLEHKANPNITDHNGNNILHYIYADEDIIDVLCEYNINVNKQNTAGETPVNIAAMNGHDEVIRKLHQNGADLDIKSLEGTPPILNCGDYYSFKALVELGCDITGVIHHYCKHELDYEVEILLSRGATWDERDEDGKQPKHSFEIGRLFDKSVYGEEYHKLHQEGKTDLEIAKFFSEKYDSEFSIEHNLREIKEYNKK